MGSCNEWPVINSPSQSLYLTGDAFTFQDGSPSFERKCSRNLYFGLKLVKTDRNMSSIVQGFTAYRSPSFGFVCMERYTQKCNCDSRHDEQSLPPTEDKKKWQ